MSGNATKSRLNSTLAWRVCLALPLVFAVLGVLWIRPTAGPNASPKAPPPSLDWKLIAQDRSIEAWVLRGSDVIALSELGIFATASVTGDDWRERPIVVASDAIPAYKDLPAIPALPILETTSAVAVGPDGAVVIVGGVEESASSTILRSTDDGRSWVRAPSVEAGLLTSVRFAGDVGIATGPAGGILRSTDDGATWMPSPASTQLDLFASALTTSGHAIAAGEQGVVLRSDDGGLHWTGAVFGGHALFACALLDDRRGWVAGDAGTILATNDGGQTFVEVGLVAPEGLARLPAIASLAVVYVWEDPLVVAGCEGGLILVGRGDGAWSESRLPGETGTITSLLVVGDAVLAASDTGHVYRAGIPVL